MAQARLREALNAGGPGSQKEKGPPSPDGILSVTPDTPEAVEWRTRQSVIDSAGASSSYLEDDSGEGFCSCYLRTALAREPCHALSFLAHP